MQLTPDAQQSIEFARTCLFQGLCTAKEYLSSVKKIYQEDLTKQVDFLMEREFTRIGALKHIYKLDVGSEVL